MAAGDFTTSDAVIAYLQTSANANSFDVAEIDKLITGATQWIINYCNDNFLAANYTEYRDGVGLYIRQPTYVFAARPVSAVSAVSVAGQAIQPLTLPMTAAFSVGYAALADKLVFYGVSVPLLPLCVSFSYTAGYATIPSDIEQACIELVAQKYRARTRIGVSSESAAGIGSRTYSVAMLPPDTQRDLDLRRRVAPISGILLGGTPIGGAPLAGQSIPLSISYQAGLDPGNTPFADIRQAMTIIAIGGTVEVPLGAAGTLSIVKAASGTALSSGTVLHSGSFDANGTAATEQLLTVTTTSLAAGDRLGLISTGGNWAAGSAVGVLTVFVQ
jgi:hypothetical protein